MYYNTQWQLNGHTEFFTYNLNYNTLEYVQCNSLYAEICMLNRNLFGMKECSDALEFQWNHVNCIFYGDFKYPRNKMYEWGMNIQWT
jgi:hypothetical protein